MTKRVYSIPCIRDVVTFIETAAESEGRQTLVEVVLAPGEACPCTGIGSLMKSLPPLRENRV